MWEWELEPTVFVEPKWRLSYQMPMNNKIARSFMLQKKKGRKRNHGLGNILSGISVMESRSKSLKTQYVTQKLRINFLLYPDARDG
jgi:hypothetical protein